MGLEGLDFQVVDVKLDQGLDTKTQRKLVLPGKWDQLVNLTLANDGTPRRRDGIAGVVTTANGNGVATREKELLVINGGTLKSVGAQTAITKAGSLGYVGVAKSEVRRSGGMQSAFDCATGNGLTCYVWIESVFSGNVVTPASINYAIVDEVSGAQIVSNSVVVASSGASCPRVVFSPSAGGTATEAFMIFWLDAAGPNLSCSVVQTATPTVLGAAVALITSASLSVGSNFDAISAYLNGTRKGAMLAYWWQTAGRSVETIHVSHAAGVPAIDAGPTAAALMTQAQIDFTTQQALCCVEFSANRKGVFAMARTGALAGIAGAVIDDTWAITTAAAQLDATVTPNAGGCHLTGALEGASVYLFADQQSQWGRSPGFRPIRVMGVSSTLALTSGPSTLTNSAAFSAAGGFAVGPSGPWICGKAFVSGTSVYLPCCVMEQYTLLTADNVTKNEQNAFFLLEATGATHNAATVVARALYGTFGFPFATGTPGANPIPTVSTPCSSPALAAGGFALCCSERQILSLANGLNISASGVCRLTLTPNTTVPPIRTELGQSAFFAGGQLCAYDGAGVTEHGFPLFPEGISVLRRAGAGDLTAGVHQVVAIYEYTDNQGRRHQSGPSQPVSFTSLGGDTADVVVPTLLLSQKTGVQIVLYMTQAAGLSFNRVVSIASPVPNVTTAESVTITLGVAAHLAADATIRSNELLYNQPNLPGTTLPNTSPGPCSALGIHQNRLFLDVTDNPNAFRYSQQLSPYIGLQFSDALGGIVPESGGGIVGFAELDDKVIILCARKLFVVYGSGPTPSGGFASYSDPQEISSDVGCVEPRSILKMPMGIIFKAQKGWYLLGRDLAVRFIGAGVDSFNTNSVCSAVLLEDRQECRFGSASGTQLIYCYGDDTWSTTVYRVDTGPGAATYLPADAIWWAAPVGGQYVTVSLTNGLNADTPGVFIDQPGGAGNPLAITTTARTAWLHMGQLAGFQRIRWMFLSGTSPAAPTSTLTIKVDFDDAYNQVAPGAYNFAVAMATAFPGFVVGRSVDLRSKLRRQKCKSIAFTFIDVPTLANPAGVNFQALSLEVGFKRGLSKLPAAQTVG